jgi:hypothetical protein
MSEDKYALSPAWENSSKYKQPFDYTLEGTKQTVFLRRLDMGDLLKLGIAEELDFMSKALMQDDKSKEAKEAVSSAVMQGENFERMETMVNAVVVAGVIKPKIQAVPAHDAARQPGQVYVDSVPFNDRIELFSVIFDSEGLSTFREEQEDGVGNVADEPSVPLPTDEPVAVRSDDTQGVLLQ